MIIKLRQLPSERVRGTYTIHGIANRMPDRALFLEPAAADSYLKDLADHITISDMLRSPESSLQAVANGRGALPPAFSGHNFGKSIDIEVDLAMKTLGLHSKKDLDLWMEARGWFCFWRDGKIAHSIGGKTSTSEIWHYNFFGVGYEISDKVDTTTGYLEAEIKRLYETDFQSMLANVKLQQVALAEIRMYGGEIDGISGPRQAAGLTMFQKSVDLPATGKIDYRTARTLAFVTHETALT